MNGQIADFAFTSEKPSDSGPDFAKTTVYAGSKQGKVFFQEIHYKLNSFASKMSPEEKMKCDNDNSYMMIETLTFDPKFSIQENRT